MAEYQWELHLRRYASNCFAEFLRPDAGTGKSPCEKAAPLGNAHREREFPSDELESRGLLRGPAHGQRFSRVRHYEQSELRALGFGYELQLHAKAFGARACREFVRPAISGCRRLSCARIELAAGHEIRVGRRVARRVLYLPLSHGENDHRGSGHRAGSAGEIRGRHRTRSARAAFDGDEGVLRVLAALW